MEGDTRVTDAFLKALRKNVDKIKVRQSACR